jgi:hypothetical protein
MTNFDRAAVANRLRSLLVGQSGGLEDAAARLGIEELSLRLSIDELSPHPTVEVLAAVVRVYGVDPTWLLTGEYDAGTHRAVMEGEIDASRWMWNLIGQRPVRVSQPVDENPFRPGNN